MRSIFFIIACCLALADLRAQKITQEYNNVSLSEALRQLNEQTDDYTISFLYNELEDFRITTSVHRKSVPDAIRQMIGFYPIRMTVENKEIVVECAQKTTIRYIGNIIDEQGQPVAYANVALLSPQDSTLITGGVSNESGLFVIPCEQKPVLARISFVGYKTVYRQCNSTELGKIRMQPETQTLKGVTVKGQRLLYTPTERGLQVSVQGTPLEQFGSVSEMLSHLPLMMSNGEIAGHGKPEIYINNKKVRNEDELNRLRADEILSAEIITNPGVEYGAEVTSVIRLKTIRKTGEGWSGNFSSAYRQGKEYYANGNAALNYRTRSGMDFFARGYLTSNNQYITATAADQLQASSTWDFKKDATYLNRYNYYFADLGWNWEISEKHSLGLTYTANNFISDATSSIETDEEVWRDSHFLEAETNKTVTSRKPRMEHAVNAYYVGEIGKWKLDFSADYYGGHSESEMTGGTVGMTGVSSKTQTKNNLLAEKLVVTAPIPTGSLTFGEEAVTVDRTSDFTQSGFSADNSVHQQTMTWSLFVNYALQMKKFGLNAGLRWQNEHNDYETNGRKDAEQSPDYHVLIPRLSFTYRTEQWTHTFSYQSTRNNPPYSILSTAIHYRSKYEYSTGNAYLQPQTTHSLSWTSQWKWLYIQSYYKYMHNAITSFQTSYDDVNHPGVVIMDYRNIPKMQDYGIVLSFSPKVGIWQMNYTARFFYNNIDYESMGITHTWNGMISELTLDNTFSFPKDWLLNIQGYIKPAHETGCSQRETLGDINLRLSRQFLKDKSLSVAILVNDIFHTRYTEMTAYGGINVRTQFREYRDSRRIGINLTWKFNAIKSRYKGTHAGQSERSRL
ncbi:MAG: TonB-dependent receptor family protein [Bacteroidaceae bacterium]|nr:TonB-dependent receptor family protein [Bacteroidaceae bacterium]